MSERLAITTTIALALLLLLLFGEDGERSALALTS